MLRSCFGNMFSHFSPYFPSELDLKSYLTWSLGFIKGKKKISYSLSHNHISNIDCVNIVAATAPWSATPSNRHSVCSSKQKSTETNCLGRLLMCCMTPDSFPTGTLTRCALHCVPSWFHSSYLYLTRLIKILFKKINLFTNKLGQFKHSFALYIKPPQKCVIT